MAKSVQYMPLVGLPDRTAPTRAGQIFVLLLITAILYLATPFTTQTPLPSANPPLDNNIWSSIPPSTSLTFTPCFGSLQCARLLVPLNWNASTTDSNATVSLAVIKRPARVPVTDPRYGGPVIVNPGGPGESGVYQVLSDSAALQTVLDSPDDQGKLYDIVSFDPRGVNNTTPRLRCFRDAFAQQVWQLGATDYGLLWDSERVVGLEWARAAALGQSCAHGDDDDDEGMLRYVNTAQTVEDMRHLVEKLGEWRAAEARRTASNHTYDGLAYRPGHEKLQYWGLSYGTLLGATFAALHPHRVGRMVLDGVVDPADHYAGAWRTQLQDSDAIVTQLSADCFAAGPRGCALHTGSSSADVEARLTSILQTLKDAPLPVDTVGGDGPVLITYGDVHLALLSAMYSPFAMAAPLFRLLPALERRDASDAEIVRLAARKQGALVPASARSDEPVPYVSAMGAVQSIACMDSVGAAPPLTRATFRAYLAELRAQGRWISPSWARNRLACVGFDVAPVWRPALSFERQEWASPAHPLLLVGNTHDTVTPLRNAHRVAGLFPGSVVLQQDGEGHCSHAMPSLCTARVIREYMQTGTLPAQGTVCAPDVRPFVGCRRQASCSFQGEDRRLWDALVTLADPFRLQINSFPLHL